MARKNDKMMEKILEEVVMDFTSMIDVTFQLLIFFMLTLKFKILEGKLESLLPLDKGLSNKEVTIEFEDVEIVLKVLEEDKAKDSAQRRVRYFRNGSNTPFGTSTSTWDKDKKQFVCDPPDTLVRIKAHLDSVRTASKESKAKINAWPEVPHDRVVNVLNMMVEAGFTDISYSGIPNNLIADLMSGKVSSKERKN